MCYKSAYHPKWGRHHYRHHAKKHWRNKFLARVYPPVNVEEYDDHYEIDLFAAGYTKEEFNVSVKDDTLIISVKKEDAEGNTETYFGRSTFKPGNFERQFILNEKINKEGINAKYEEGVLKVTLPKNEGSETFRQDIDIV